MFVLPKRVINEIPKFNDNLNKFLTGEIKDSFFRGIRVPWGNYTQRGGKMLMSRLRIPGGILLPEQIRAIADAAAQFATSKIHITTRQDIQIHNVTFTNSVKIIEYLKNYQISPRGGGGNTVRNITGCYLSGICAKEKVVVYPYVTGLTEFLLTLDESYNLPRKFKISFSGCGQDCAFAGVNDIGFIAQNGGFKVICGGGMGAKSSVGKILAETVTPEDIGYIVKSVMNVFNLYGDRKNRHHNRLRFLITDLGWDKFVDLYHQEYNKIKENEYLVLRTVDDLPDLDNRENISIETENVPEYKQFFKFNVRPQKQNGYYYINIKIPYGEIESNTLNELVMIKEIVPQLIFHTTPRQNLVLSNVPADKIYHVYQKLNSVLNDFIYPETVLDVISCKASTTCNLGICNAIALAPEIVKELNQIKPDLDILKEVRINLNGCPNACGQHPLGTVSLYGMARKVHNRTVPFYKICLGGKVNAENTRLAKEIGMIPARNVPKFIAEFVCLLQKAVNVDEFITFVYIDNPVVKETVTSLINKYAYVPTYEDNREFFIDFGRTENFSLEGLTQGECGAGVIDMIESDLESAKQSLNKAKGNNNLTDLKKSILYSAHALLVVKGIDPNTEEEAIAAFYEKFVLSSIADPEFVNITEIYKQLKNNSCTGEEIYPYAEKLYREIKKIYSLMDSNFNFPVSHPIQPVEKKDTSTNLPVTLFDLRGTPCPINYVKTKLKLETLNFDDLLEVYLDDGEPIRNVPQSLKNDGQEIISITQKDNYFSLLIKKKV